MDMKEAAKTAKDFVKELFADEGADSLLLEGAEYLSNDDLWKVTVSFQRHSIEAPPLDAGLKDAVSLSGGLSHLIRSLRRSSKVVTISNREARVLSVQAREEAARSSVPYYSIPTCLSY